MNNNEISFQQASLTHLPEIVEMIADDQLGAQREALTAPLAKEYLDAFSAIEADPNQLLAVALYNSRPMGTLQISLIPGIARKGTLRGQIEAIRIAKEHRGSGIGRQFLEWAIAWCRSNGCSLVQLTTDKSRSKAHSLYESLGFKASHEGYKLFL